jgi:hypothetical protein
VVVGDQLAQRAGKHQLMLTSRPTPQ